MDIPDIHNVRGIINPHLPLDYEIKCLVNEGSMGAIYSAVSQKSGFFLAIKVAKAPKNRNMLHEFSTQNQLKHRNIGAVFGFKQLEIYSIISMELLTGGDLFDLIPVGKGINILKGYKIYSDLLDALDFCHKNQIVHMDIKPENVMMSNSGTPKLIDFGLAVDHKQKPLIKGYVGTFAYSAPETFTKSEYTGYKADIFSLNLTLLTIVTGERCWHRARFDDPFYRDWFDQQWTLEVFRRIPADLLNFLLLALAHDPDKRLSIDQIREHIWFKSGAKSTLQALKPPTKNLNSFEAPTSQPLIQNVGGLFECQDIPMSQPIDLANILMPAIGNDKQIVKRMTRFFSKESATETLKILTILIYQHNHCKILIYSSNCLTVECVMSGFSATFRIFVYAFAGSILVDFRRIKGDGLLFRDIYGYIKSAMVQQGVEDNETEYMAMLQCPN